MIRQMCWMAMLAAVGLVASLVTNVFGPPATPDASPASVAPLVVGAVPYWAQAESSASLVQHAPRVDVATEWAYGVNPDGSISLPRTTARMNDPALATQLRPQNVAMIPTVANTTGGGWDGATVARVIGDPVLRGAHIAALLKLITDNDFAGVQIDYEDLTGADRSNFSVFVSELSPAVHRVGKVLYVTLHPKENDAGYDQRNLAQDYSVVGQAADKVVLMAYDWHWQSGASGPIAPLSWVGSVVRYTTSQVPAAKILLGVPLYGYDWVGTKAQVLTWNQVQQLVAAHQAQVQWDEASQSPHFTYMTDGVTHEVWFENARSVGLKVGLGTQNKLGGIELWRLGGEDPAVWDQLPG